jgi:hypothetical protein
MLSTATVRPEVPLSPTFAGRLIPQSPVAAEDRPKIGCCCHRPRVNVAPSLDEGIRYSMEQPAIVQVKRLGGSVKSERFGSKSYVTEVDLVVRDRRDGHQIEKTTFTDDALRQIARFQHLKVLALAGGHITDGGLKRIAALKELEGLVLRDARLVSPEGMAELVKLPHLRRLELTNAPIGDAGFARLAAMQTLEELSVEGSQLSVESLDVAARLPKLKSLSLDLGNHGIGRESLLSLHALRNLKRLSLRCSEISDEALLEMKSLKNLRLLSLGDSRVSQRALASLRRSLPHLAIKTAQQTLGA